MDSITLRVSATAQIITFFFLHELLACNIRFFSLKKLNEVNYTRLAEAFGEHISARSSGSQRVCSGNL